MVEIPQWLQLGLAGLVGAFVLWLKARLGRSAATLQRQTIQETLDALRLSEEVARVQREHARQLAEAQAVQAHEVQVLLEKTHEAVNSGRTRLEESLITLRVTSEQRIALLESNLREALVAMAHAQGISQGLQGVQLPPASAAVETPSPPLIIPA